MRRARPLFAVLLSLAMPALAHAQGSLLARSPAAQVTLRSGTATASLVTGLDLRLPGDDRVEAARALLTEDAELFGFDPALSDLVPVRPQTAGPFTYYRFHQRHLGLPVLGADAVVTVDCAGVVRMVGAALARPGEVPTTFAVDAEQAAAVAARVVQPERWPGKPKLVRRALAGVAGDWRGVWEVVVAAERPLGAHHVWVDGITGEVLQSTNHLLHQFQGYAYPNCPEAGAYTQVALANLSDPAGLKGDYIDLYSDCTPASMGGYGCAPTDRVAKPDANGDYFLLPKEGSTSDGFAEVHTFFHLNQMHDWFKSTGFDGLDHISMPVAVNYTQDYQMSCNAGYAESAIIVGLCNLQLLGGSGYVNFAYDSLSVMHEYTHGAVDHGAGVDFYAVDSMGLVAQQMGLHEGFADFFPAMVLDDPKVGRHVGPKTGTGEYFRTLTEFRSCPDHLVGEAHEDGQIWGSANWEAYVATGKSQEAPRALFEGLLALTTRPTFQEAALAVLAAATTAHPTVLAQLQDAYTAHGLMGCGRELEIRSGQKLSGSLSNPQYMGLSSSTPFEAQYKVLVPAGASSLAWTLKGTNDQGSTVSNVKFYVQYGSPVVYKTSGMSCLQPNCTVRTSSFTMTNPAPGPYYVLPVGTNYGWVQAYGFEVTATVTGGEAYDGGFPWYPDGGLPGLDAARPDAAMPKDAAAPGPDAAAPGPDAAAPGPDASTVVVGSDAEVVPSPDGSAVGAGDASQPAGLDAATAGTDAGGSPGSNGCGCGLPGTTDPAAGAFVLAAGLALARSIRRRQA